MTVPTVTVKGLSHSLHQWTPGRVLFPASFEMRAGSALPQWRQATPSGQYNRSRCSRALLASVKIGFVRSLMGLSSIGRILAHISFYVKYIIARVWAKETPELGDLTGAEFRTLVESVGTVASINGRVTTLHIVPKQEFEHVLSEVGVLADRIPSWNELNYFAATIAEGAGNYGRALTFYQHIKDSKRPSINGELLEAKISSVKINLGGTSRETTESTLEILNGYAYYATSVLNRLFEYQLPPPEIELKESTF